MTRLLEDVIEEADEAMEILEPKVDAKRWVVGKPPEEGGKETEYSVYTQLPLGYMARNRMFSLIGRTMSAAIKSTGGSVGGMEDVFGSGGGTLVERGQAAGSTRLSRRFTVLHTGDGACRLRAGLPERLLHHRAGGSDRRARLVP